MPDVNQPMNENDLFISFPTNSEWKEIYSESNINKIQTLIENILFTTSENTTFDFFDILEIRSFGAEIYHRFIAAARSYILLTYYFQKGIPDDEVRKLLEVGGFKLDFPEFESHHYEIKSWFDYYCDNFYFYLFAGLNSISHILNKCYGLKIKRTDFGLVISSLKVAVSTKNSFQEFLNIIHSAPYRKASKIRNDIAHNFLPNRLGNKVVRSGESYPIFSAVVSKPYVRSKDIFNNCNDSLVLFEKILQLTINSAIIPYFSKTEPPCLTENKSN